MMDAKTLADKFVRTVVTPQGTADVYLGDVHIKTLGGAHAEAGANQLKDQLVSVIVTIVSEWDDGKLPEIVKVDEVTGEKKLKHWP